jgi:hypothetical protein
MEWTRFQQGSPQIVKPASGRKAWEYRKEYVAGKRYRNIFGSAADTDSFLRKT